MAKSVGRVALLYPGDLEKRRSATLETSRFADLVQALQARNLLVEPAVYHDDIHDEVRSQLLQLDGVVVWVNPIESGRERTVLDAMLREVSDAGVFVSTHPEVILKLGTKEVLYRTRSIGWGCEIYLYETIDQLRDGLSLRLSSGKARVLKQYRGNGGQGVWKVGLPSTEGTANDGPAVLGPEVVVHVRHAKRGCYEEAMTLGRFLSECEQYFSGSGRMIDQAYQERLPEGMIRCYLAHDRVVGFGHQAINALFPAPTGKPPTAAPQPGPRLYHPVSKPEFQSLKTKLETNWVPAVQELLDISTEALPVLWDCDFLLGPKGPQGEDTYVLCEINVSSVAPYPETGVPYIADAIATRVRDARRRRGTRP